MKFLRPDLVAIRGWLGWTHLLVSGRDLVLIDTGLFGDARRIRPAVQPLGQLRAIVLTHGHLDHTSNAAPLQEWSGAAVYAPVGDETHLAGTHRYRGASQICGRLEAVGRALLRDRPPRVDVWLRDGAELPFWGGLQVIGLPGHTAGHIGLYSPTKRVLFAGDAFAVRVRIALPPGFLNTDTAQVRQSFLKVAAIEARQVVPAHYFWWPADLPARLRLRARQLRSTMRPG
jgi:glyoxylase-like metal-dependent hydrolase (beta-lactamase superfamily II)